MEEVIRPKHACYCCGKRLRRRTSLFCDCGCRERFVAAAHGPGGPARGAAANGHDRVTTGPPLAQRGMSV
jgi:hypothetical protein